jgi:hypothetical protein
MSKINKFDDISDLLEENANPKKETKTTSSFKRGDFLGALQKSKTGMNDNKSFMITANSNEDGVENTIINLTYFI